MCSAANERNFTLLPSASSSVFILPAAASEAFGIRCYNECWAITGLVQPHAGTVAGEMASRRWGHPLCKNKLYFKVGSPVCF